MRLLRDVGFSPRQFLRYEPETSGIDVTLFRPYNDIPPKSNSHGIMPNQTFSRTTWAHFPPKVLKMSLTRIEKYSERGYILKNPPGRLLIVTYWTALGVWLTPGGRRFEPTKSPKFHRVKLF